VEAYEEWNRTGDRDGLRAVNERGRRHWSTVAGDLLSIHRDGPADLHAAIVSRVESATF
jgi:hypothetical protein